MKVRLGQCHKCDSVVDARGWEELASGKVQKGEVAWTLGTRRARRQAHSSMSRQWKAWLQVFVVQRLYGDDL
jgi:hypothetical protein